MLVFIVKKKESRSPSLLDAPTNPGPCLLPIISCPIIALGSICDHTDYQRGNPCVRGLCFFTKGNLQVELQEKGVIDGGCSRYMTGNMSYLFYYEKINGGYVAFEGDPKGGKITGKDFKLTDESHVLLKVPRKDNMYSIDLKNVVP
ncbi:hypothetical protein Tco_0684040 [Tanacetum coccineum]